jgi:hypothetical protein
MYRRAGNTIPEDVSFPTHLPELGLKRDLRGLYVQIEDEDEFDYYEHFDTKEMNDKRHEAVHEAIRDDVYGMLSKIGINTIYAHGKEISTAGKIAEEKPKIKMLYGGFGADDETDTNDTNDTKEVFVFIGDSRRELGIFSRLITSTAGGPREGTVLGVAQALRTHYSWAGVPPILVLNPGELLYSHETKSCMTQDIWNTRKRPHAFAEQYAVKEQNRVPGHTTSEEHVKTVIDEILPQLVKEQHKRIHIIAIGDGGDNAMKYLGEKLADDPNTKIGGLALGSVALVNSSTDEDTIHSDQLKKFMAKHGRAWVSSAEPKNKVLGKVAIEFAHYSQDQYDDNTSSDGAIPAMSMIFAKRPVPPIGRTRAVSSLSESLKEQKRTGGPHNDITRVQEDVFKEVFYSTSQSSASSSEAGIALPPLISDKYPSMSVPGLTMKAYRKACDYGGPEQRRRSSASIHDTTLANPDQYRISGPSCPIPIPNYDRSAAYHNARAAEVRKFADQNKVLDDMKILQDAKDLKVKMDRKLKKAAEIQKAREAEKAKNLLEDEITVAERQMNEMAARTGQLTFEPEPDHDIVTQYATVPTYADDEAAVVPTETTATTIQAHDYYNKPCICTTVSAGLEDVTEQLFTAVRHDVLEFIFQQKERKEVKQRAKEKRVKELRESVSSMGLQESVEEA